MDGLATLACLPEPISGRNRMMRHLIVEAIQTDPDWKGGEYAEQPRLALHHAMELWMVMSSSALQMQKSAPTRDAADKWVEEYIARRMAGSDANDVIYYTDASRNFDASPKLESIKAPVLWINTADDFINPPELGIAEKSAKRMANCKFILLPTTDQTRGHGTYMFAAVWKDYLAEFMKSTEKQ
jgi:homoserine O-acetyltransferase